MFSRQKIVLSGAIAIFLLVGLVRFAYAEAFVHLFEWRWDDIAIECEDFLGPNGYTAVQISPPNEHRMLLGRPWYERYQPVSYKLISRSGTREELVQMIERCHQSGVKIYADAVINHMASCRPECDQNQPQYGDQGVGGTSFEVGGYTFDDLFAEQDEGRVEGALDAFTSEHFHHECTQVSNWSDPWQVQNCELERLADLATERDDVRSTIANYLATLFELGIDGIRIDAAKHFLPEDLNAILWKAALVADVHIEGTNINYGASRTVLVFQEYIGTPANLQGTYANGKVTEFDFGVAIATAFLKWDGLQASQAASLIGSRNMQSGINVITFIDNHDNQRGHGGGGRVFAHRGSDGLNYGIRNNLAAYKLANIFMLAYPYGYPKVMSSYRFGNRELWAEQNPRQDVTAVVELPVKDDFLGPPHLGSHQSELTATDYKQADTWLTQPVWVEDEQGEWQNHCFDPGSKWVCEHRWREIKNMVTFRQATAPAWRVDNWWDNGGNQFAFGRGELGFILFNAQPDSDPQTMGPEGDGWFQTGLPTGLYCDIIHSDLTPDKSECLGEEGVSIDPIEVFEDGKAQFTVSAMDSVAIHIEGRIE